MADSSRRMHDRRGVAAFVSVVSFIYGGCAHGGDLSFLGGGNALHIFLVYFLHFCFL